MSPDEPRAGTQPRARSGARPRPARRMVPAALLVTAVLVALLLGILIGYAARGGGSASEPVTLESDLPVVTVTVEGPVGR
jgi:hypothetical protein